ncbi:hypothetical protein RB195_020506 [Necator americanus]|uniref:Uncharacterized protein n=1 Tax=Necator americanus TaxID=51031 RepID=A0ABR1CJ67_NECAM
MKIPKTVILVAIFLQNVLSGPLADHGETEAVSKIVPNSNFRKCDVLGDNTISLCPSNQTNSISESNNMISRTFESKDKKYKITEEELSAEVIKNSSSFTKLGNDSIATYTYKRTFEKKFIFNRIPVPHPNQGTTTPRTPTTPSAETVVSTGYVTRTLSTNGETTAKTERVTHPPKPEVNTGWTERVTPLPLPEVTNGRTERITHPPRPEVTTGRTERVTHPPRPEVTNGRTERVTHPPRPEVTNGRTERVTHPPRPEVTNGRTERVTWPPLPEVTNGRTERITHPPRPEVTTGRTERVTHPPRPEVTTGRTERITHPPRPEVTNGRTERVTNPPLPEVTNGRTERVTHPPLPEVTIGRTERVTHPPLPEVTNGRTERVTHPPRPEVTNGRTERITHPPRPEVTNGRTERITHPPRPEVTNGRTERVTHPPRPEVTNGRTERVTHPPRPEVTNGRTERITHPPLPEVTNGRTERITHPPRPEVTNSKTERVTQSTEPEGFTAETKIVTDALSTEEMRGSTELVTQPETFGTTKVYRSANVSCLFAGDLLNFGSEQEAYEKEKKFMIEVGRRLFSTTKNAKAVSWAYGYTSGPKGLKTTFTTMKDSFAGFVEDVMTKMKYEDLEKPNLTNSGAISNLNTASDKEKNANCLVFFSGLKSANNLRKTLKLNPKGMNNFKRVVAVSLNGADLGTLVVPPKGEAVTVTDHYSEKDVSKVVDKILAVF